MTPFFTDRFKKNYAKRIALNENLKKRFQERYDIFVEDHTNEILKDHALSGTMKEYRAFSITGDIRVVYYVFENIAYFVDIGSHNQIY